MELEAQYKTVTVKREQLKGHESMAAPSGFGRPKANVAPWQMPSTRTPLHAGAATPMHGSATPMHPSATPMHPSATPMHPGRQNSPLCVLLGFMYVHPCTPRLQAKDHKRNLPHQRHCMRYLPYGSSEVLSELLWHCFYCCTAIHACAQLEFRLPSLTGSAYWRYVSPQQPMQCCCSSCQTADISVIVKWLAFDCPHGGSARYLTIAAGAATPLRDAWSGGRTPMHPSMEGGADDYDGYGSQRGATPSYAAGGYAGTPFNPSSDDGRHVSLYDLLQLPAC